MNDCEMCVKNIECASGLPNGSPVLGSPSGSLQTHKQGLRGKFLHHHIPRVNAPEKDQSRNNKREIDDVLNSITG
jgi:hypothetical protein